MEHFICFDFQFHRTNGLGSDQPPSRPLTPTQQLNIMKDIEKELSNRQLDPTRNDMDVSLIFKFFIPKTTILIFFI